MGGVGAQYKKSLEFGRWRLPNIHGTSSVALAGVGGVTESSLLEPEVGIRDAPKVDPGDSWLLWSSAQQTWTGNGSQGSPEKDSKS